MFRYWSLHMLQRRVHFWQVFGNLLCVAVSHSGLKHLWTILWSWLTRSCEIKTRKCREDSQVIISQNQMSKYWMKMCESHEVLKDFTFLSPHVTTFLLIKQIFPFLLPTTDLKCVLYFLLANSPHTKHLSSLELQWLIHQQKKKKKSRNRKANRQLFWQLINRFSHFLIEK